MLQYLYVNYMVLEFKNVVEIDYGVILRSRSNINIYLENIVEYQSINNCFR